jgi:transposase InsO family protein
VAQLYRLRKSRTYRKRRVVYQATRPTQVAIGQRRAPRPEGRPGYLRVDTVHQGDWDGAKGVYHINAVDEVTQWQVVGAAGQITEAALRPVLEAMLEQFPFRIRGFHSDNGSEFINHTVAGLLNKLLIEQTKSRPRHCNDNGLVECKNGAVIRKHMGYGYIAPRHAEAIGASYPNFRILLWKSGVFGAFRNRISFAVNGGFSDSVKIVTNIRRHPGGRIWGWYRLVRCRFLLQSLSIRCI